MSRAVDHIKDINDTKEIWKLAIKVDDIWTNVKSSKEYAEMIVRDIQVLQPSMLIYV
jgi:archaellum component FlaC